MAGVLAACATPATDPWQDLSISTEQTAGPQPLPELPRASIENGNAVLTPDQAAIVRDYRIVAEANTAMAQEYARAIDARKQQASALVEAGRAQRQVADIRAEIIAEERRHHFIEKIGLYAVIIGLGLAL